MPKRFPFFVTILTSLTFSSCLLTPQQIISIQTDIYETKNQVRRLQAIETDSKQTILTEVRTLGEKIEGKNKLLNSNLADMESRLLSLEEAIRELKGITLELKFQISTKKLLGSETRAVDSHNLFKSAINDYTNGNYDAAAKNFTLFYQRYPDSPDAPQAIYSLGNCYFFKKNLSKAASSYIATADMYSSSNLAPQALFKAAQCYKTLKDFEKSLQSLEKIAINYPDFDQILTVKEEITNIKQKIEKAY